MPTPPRTSTASGLLLLVGLKLRLASRVFSRRRKGALALTVVAFVLVTLTFAPMWLGLTAAAYFGVRRLGSDAVAVGFGLVHITWIAGSLLLSSFAEGIDMRALLRYPVRPRSVFWLNVLIAPLDVVALFLLPPLAAMAIATAARSGAVAGTAVALAAVLLLLITSAVTQTLLALLGRYLRREWTRALFGLLVGVAFMLPTLYLRQGAQRESGLRRGIFSSLPGIGEAFAWLPSTALPVRAALAASAGQLVACAALLLGGALVLLALVELGTRMALHEALNRQAPGERRAPPADSPDERLARHRPRPTGLRRLIEGLLARLPASDDGLAPLTIMIGRELRTYVRTPQVLVGLLLLPVLLLVLPRQMSMGPEMKPFLVAFLCLASALNLSGNQFGLDQAGVRLLFLLPISARRLLLAKNLALTVLVALLALACLVVGWLGGGGLAATEALSMLLTVAAALPVVLTFGCFLSIYHPWRMVFRLGGAPPGAMISAFAQMAALALVGVLLIPVLVVLPAAMGDGPLTKFLSLAATALLAAILWLLWRLALARAARALHARREILIDRLARATESG